MSIVIIVSIFAVFAVLEKVGSEQVWSRERKYVQTQSKTEETYVIKKKS